MSNFADIVRNHNATYYDFDTDIQRAVWPRYLIVAFVSAAYVFVFNSLSTDALGALLTVQSILIGFSFSVMFFLLSGSIPEIKDNGSIESDLKRKRLTKLSKELFYNVSYFNVIAISSVVLALLLLLPNFDTRSFLEWVQNHSELQFWTEAQWRAKFALVADYLFPTLEFLLIAFLAESLTTFARTVGRVSFYFERRLKLEE